MNTSKTFGRLAGLTVIGLLTTGTVLVGTAGGAAAAPKPNTGPEPVAAAWMKDPGQATDPLRGAQAATIVGTWTVTTDFGCDGTPTGSPFQQTFNADGTWRAVLPTRVVTGRYIQVGGMAIWNVDNDPGLVFSANINGNQLSGIQGFLFAGGSTGCFTAKR